MSHLISPHSCVVLLCFVLVLPGCALYYKPIAVPGTSPTETLSLIRDHRDRYMVLRQGDAAYALENPRFSEDSISLIATVDSIDAKHLKYVKAVPRKYSGSNKHVENELHLYSSAPHAGYDTEIQIPLAAVDKIELLERDKKRSTKSFFIGFGSTVVGVIILGRIAFDSSSFSPW